MVIMKDKEEGSHKCSLIHLEPFLDNNTPFRVIMKDKEESNQKCSLIYLEPFLDNNTPFRVIMTHLSVLL